MGLLSLLAGVALRICLLGFLLHLCFDVAPSKVFSLLRELLLKEGTPASLFIIITGTGLGLPAPFLSTFSLQWAAGSLIARKPIWGAPADSPLGSGYPCYLLLGARSLDISLP